MGLGPTQGDEKRLQSGSRLSSNRSSWKRSPSPLSSRAQPRDLQFRGPFLEMFFDRAYPDFPPVVLEGSACAVRLSEMIKRSELRSRPLSEMRCYYGRELSRYWSSTALPDPALLRISPHSADPAKPETYP